MAEVVASKLKLLHLAKILMTETDDDHGLTGPQLIAKLAERGIDVERKTLYRDLECLRAFGFDIVKYDRHPVEYGIATRDFQEQELLILADAVQSSKFLTQRKSDALVAAIGKLGSKYMAADLRKRVHIAGRIKSQNESVFYNIDAIQRAINAKSKITFRYFKYNEAKERELQHDGLAYLETPVQLIYTDDEYYLVTWNDKHDGFANYRVDRMLGIDVADEPATKNDRIAHFDAAAYQQRVFGMYSGEAVNVTLLVQKSAMNAVIDRFGKDVASTPLPDGRARISTTVMEAPTFFGWLATLGTSVTIEKPTALRKAYVAHLRTIADSYDFPEADPGC